MPILTVSNLQKHYGYIQALKGVSFSVPEGSVFGILGPNGSGKTTLLGIVSDILRATSGSYQLFDQHPVPQHRKQIGTLLETPNFYHYLNAEQNLRIVASIKGRGMQDIDRVLKMVNLDQRKMHRFNTYSLGMKQRLAIASCLLGDPQVLIFDEPTNGLDPVGIMEIRELIKKLHKEGKTIIMASHLLDEVEKVCSHVAILQKGELRVHGHVNEILVTDDIVEVSAADPLQLHAVVQHYPGILNVQQREQTLELFFPSNTANLEDINKYCFTNGIVLNHLRLHKKSLERKFFELTQAN